MAAALKKSCKVYFKITVQSTLTGFIINEFGQSYHHLCSFSCACGPYLYLGFVPIAHLISLL